MDGIIAWPIAALVAYLFGSVPTGFLIVRWFTGKDLRNEHSGRSGGTNAFRAAGFWAGLGTAAGDVLKAACAVWLARWIGGGSAWMELMAGLLAIVGHNYSILLGKRTQKGFELSGGAGGAPTFGAALAMWPAAGLVILPIGAAILYFVGYASVATMSTGVIVGLLFAWRAIFADGPWAHALFGVLAEILLLWSLRPNIRRLRQGKERRVGYRSPSRSDGTSKASPDRATR